MPPIVHEQVTTRAAASSSTINTKKHFSWRDVAKGNTPECALVAVRGKVFDVTSFVERHPGGRDVLLCTVGRDATQVFETYHPLRVHEVLGKYYVGDLIDNEPCCPTFPEPSAFFKTVKARVENHFVETKQDPKYAPWMWVRYAAMLTVFAACWYGQFRVAALSHFGVQFVLAMIMGFMGALIGLMPLHDASHFAITHRPWVWRMLGAVHDFVNGASYLCWIYQHALGHHPYTNIDDADPDVQTSTHDIRRIKATQPWHAHYIPQHIYVPIAYAFLAIKTRIQDVTMTLQGMNGVVRMNKPTPSHLAVFVLGKGFCFFYRIVLPIYYGVPLWRVFVLFNVADAITSYWLALTFQANHVVEEVLWPVPDKNNKIHMDWAEHQVSTTQDYAHDSWFWNVFSGALNHQTTHHLFPWVNQFYYPQISPIVQATCKEFGIKYYYKKTFMEALLSHIGHMRNLGALAPERNKKAAGGKSSKAH